MRILKVRRVGNSNVVSIPREYEAKGYAPGSSVLLDELPDGELRLLPTDRVREQIQRVSSMQSARSASLRARCSSLADSRAASSSTLPCCHLRLQRRALPSWKVSSPSSALCRSSLSFHRPG